MRRAVAEDTPSIAEVHVRTWQETYVGQVPQAYLDALSVAGRTERWQQNLAEAPDPPLGTFVAVDDAGEVVGFMSIGPSRDPDADERTGELLAIYLRARCWGRGWGRSLMDRAEAGLMEAGFSDATLWVLDTNERARRFYEAAGWRVDGTSKLDVIGGREVNELRYHRPLRR